MKKATLLLVALLLILTVSLFFWMEDDSSLSRSLDGTEKPTATVSNGQSPPVTGSGSQSQGALNPSSTSWRPAAVFAKVGAPSPQIPYPRGENASRRYHEVTRVDIDPELTSQPPAILAQSPKDGRFDLLPEEVDEHTKAAVRLVFDPAALDQVVNGETSRVLAPTLTEEVLTLEFETVKTRSANTHTLQGHVAGEEATSVAQIVYHDGILHGSVMRYDTRQEIEYRILEDGHMMVRELDPESLADAICGTCTSGKEEVPHSHSPSPLDIQADFSDQIFSDEVAEPALQSAGEEEQEPVTRDTSGWRTIDVTVGYTTEARIADNGTSQIEGRIIAAVDRMTTAFANSGIADTELMLVGTIEDPDYVEDSSRRIYSTHDHLRFSGDGELESVSDLHNRLGSDLVAVVVSAGQGGIQGVAGGRTSVSGRTSMILSQLTFVHELGHNLGCAHAWDDTSPNNTSNNMGWRFKGVSGTEYSTIMAYTSGWGGRILYFSNPNILHPDGDIPTGVVAGYNYTTDPNPTLDPQLEAGYDGSVATRGANNAETIDTEQGAASANSATRTTFEVISPSTSDRWEKGTTRTIQFNGGDMEDLATIQLYKGGSLHSTFATDVNAALIRNFEWTIPFDHVEGTDFMIRVELDRNGSTLTADSGIFEIYSDLPHVKAQSAPAVPAGVGVVSQLELTFNVPMDPATFSEGTDIVSFTDPDGTSVVSSITGTTWSAGNTVLTIEFTPFSVSGTYQLVLGPDIEDTVGSKMDQDLDGTVGENVDDRYTANFFVNPPLIHYANMDVDPGWTFSANNPAYGWEFGQPTGGTGQAPDGVTYSIYANQYGIPDPTSGSDGPNVIGYNLDGDYDRNINSIRWATTPALDCSSYKNVTLRFQRWLGVYGSDNASIEVSNDGINWATVWHNDRQTIDEERWVEVEYDISAVADGQPTVYVRWGMGTTNSSANDDSCGWNIDEVIVFGDVLDGILLFTPDGGGSYYAGSTVDLSWASILGGNVQIELLKNSLVDSTIIASTANNGSYNWQIPAGLTAGSDYRIRITSLDDPSKIAESAADFTIISILVTSPIGGESYYAGLTANLTWESSIGGNVKIELLKNGSVNSTITANTTNDGSYAWQIPAGQTPGTDYRIRVTSLEYPSEIAVSDANFTILSFLVTSPNGGERYYQGSTASLTWTSSLGGSVQIELLKNGSVDSTIISSTTNNGSYAWQIPAGQTPGSDYRIRITSLDYPSSSGESDADFSINALPSVPYSESFASGLGDWSQESSNDIDWTLRTGSTPSSNTGPSDGQEGTGDTYLYTESSGNYNKLAQISCLFDLRAVTQADFSFYYHMYGAAMGTLLVEASTDGLVWTELFTISGDQGNSWIPVTVSLNAFTGDYATIRISGTTGSSFTSDIAVDSFAITGTTGTNTFTNWISGYSVGGQTAPGDDYDGDGLSNIVENYFGTNPGTSNRGLAAGVVTTGESTTFTFSHPINDTPASDITAAYRWSTDLSTFNGDGDTDSNGTRVDFSAGTPANGEVTVTATVTGTEPEKLFVDVEVTQN